MGTHPIFESDFDCLTEMKKNSVSGFGDLGVVVREGGMRAGRSSIQGYGGLAGAGKRQTRGTICEADIPFNIAKINNEMNLLKLEEKERQKVQKIMGGSDGISNWCLSQYRKSHERFFECY